MTSKNDLSRLFEFAPDTNRIVGYVQQVGVLTAPGATALGIAGTALNAATKEPSDKVVILQLQRLDAFLLAQSILAQLQKSGWKPPPGSYDFVARDSDRKLN